MPVRRRLLIALGPVLAVVAAAITGYMAFWDYTPIEAFYMTVITVGTVGYREVKELDAAGQIYTAAVIIAGVAAGGFALSQLFDMVLEGQLGGVWEGRRMSRMIADLQGHTIVAGTGRVGSVVARTLDAEGRPFVIIDNSPDCIEEARASGWMYIEGDATSESVLSEAGIERAGAVVTALDTDAENLFVTVTARSMSPTVFIVARCSHETTESKLLKAGANRVLTPNVIGGRRMATMVLHPTVSDYLDLVSHGSGLEYRLQEVGVSESSTISGKTLADSRLREQTGTYVLAVRHGEGGIDANPAASRTLNPGDRLVVLGTAEQVERLSRLL